MDYKEMWIDAWDNVYNAAIEAGASVEEATKRADREAGSIAYERVAGAADNLRKRERENG
jgi:hypothetical protein